jgi:imidazolonepropionase
MSMRPTLRLFRDARLATMDPSRPGLGMVEAGAVVTDGARIVFAGAEADLPPGLVDAEVVDCEGRWITPGLIDCHTHLVHAGNRAREFELRLAGASYEEIARAGGGIVSSVTALRAASEDDLVRETLPRLDALIAEGVTTVEVKSGYGLDRAAETRSLGAARRLADQRPVTVRTSFLGAHAVPPEFAGNRAGYLATVIEDMLPAVAASGLADAVDAFCEGIAFQPDEIDRLFTAARGLGLPVKLHADQLSDLGGAALAARHGALSADHLEYTGEAGAAAMAAAGTVAVMLPAAFYFIRETRVPPVDLFRRHGVAMAVATDCNPGTAPLTSLLLATNMAATLFRMTVEECLLGVTRNAARALGLDDAGVLASGMRADLAVWDVEHPAELVYRMGFNPLHRRVFGGIDTLDAGAARPRAEARP